MMSGTMRLRRLRWLCRRGMKELDILLERFLAEHEQQLATGAWPEFEALLQSEDDLLWDWLQHPAYADSAPYRKLIREIRHDTTVIH